jgi:hypothetical protein
MDDQLLNRPAVAFLPHPLQRPAISACATARSFGSIRTSFLYREAKPPMTHSPRLQQTQRTACAVCACARGLFGMGMVSRRRIGAGDGGTAL